MNDLRIALVQSRLVWEDKKANLDLLESKLAGLIANVDLIVLPETFSTGFSMEPERLAEAMDGPAMQWMQRIAKEKRCIVTGSLLLYEIREGKKVFFNRLVWMPETGQYGYYDKRHLFGLSAEKELLTAGMERKIFELQGWRICAMVCYDLRFPVWSRNIPDKEGRPAFDLLLYVANWPEPRITSWKLLLQARAIENQCYVAGVNRTDRDGKGVEHTGASTLAGPLGELLYQKENEEDIALLDLSYETLYRSRRMFPFLRDADNFILSGIQ